MVISGQETATITAITAEKRKRGLGVASESKEAMVESDVIRKRATGYAGTGGKKQIGQRGAERSTQAQIGWKRRLGGSKKGREVRRCKKNGTETEAVGLTIG